MTLVDGRFLGNDSDSVAMVSNLVLPLNEPTVEALRRAIMQFDKVIAANRPDDVRYSIRHRVLIQETLNELAPGMQS